GPGPLDAEAAQPLIAELEAQAGAWLEEEQGPPGARKIEQGALVRFAGQGGEIAVDFSLDRAELEERFRALHRALYGFDLGAAIEVVTLRVHATGTARVPPLVTLAPGALPAPEEHTEVLIGGETVSVPVYDRA